MKNLNSWLVISGLLLFILSLERLYREAIAYTPLNIPEVVNQKSIDRNQKEEKRTEKKYGRQPFKGVLTKLFGIEEVKMPEKPLTTIAPPPPPPEPPPQIILKGIILEPGGKYRAYIEIDGKKILSLRAGEGVDSITITDIKERSVILKWKDQTMELSIEPKRR